MISNNKIIEIFCKLDDFSKEHDLVLTKNSRSSGLTTKKRNRKFKISDSEVMTIRVIFHLKSYRDLKHFYLNHVCKHRQDMLPVNSVNSFENWYNLKVNFIPDYKSKFFFRVFLFSIVLIITASK